MSDAKSSGKIFLEAHLPVFDDETVGAVIQRSIPTLRPLQWNRKRTSVFVPSFSDAHANGNGKTGFLVDVEWRQDGTILSAELTAENHRWMKLACALTGGVFESNRDGVKQVLYTGPTSKDLADRFKVAVARRNGVVVGFDKVPDARIAARILTALGCDIDIVSKIVLPKNEWGGIDDDNMSVSFNIDKINIAEYTPITKTLSIFVRQDPLIRNRILGGQRKELPLEYYFPKDVAFVEETPVRESLRADAGAKTVSEAVPPDAAPRPRMPR